MPELSATAPVEIYRDLAIYERERQNIFARTWQFVGLEADLVRVGDYLAETLAGYPIVVVRDEQKQLRAYHNLCRHRAGPLVGDTKGRCDGEFVCQFHEWRYGFDGALKDAAGFATTEGFDARAFGLIPIRVETWRRFVFVNMDMAAAPLADLLRPLDEKLGARRNRSAIVRDRHPVACNWKVYVENYLDGDHLEEDDRESASHGSTHVHGVRIHGELALCDTHHSNAAESLWAWIWPNLGITVYRGVLLIEQMRPVGPDRTQIDHIFLHTAEDPGVDAAIHASEHVTEEHAWICERVQQNLDAGIYHQGILSSASESAVAWFQSRVGLALAIK